MKNETLLNERTTTTSNRENERTMKNSMMRVAGRKKGLRLSTKQEIERSANTRGTITRALELEGLLNVATNTEGILLPPLEGLAVTVTRRTKTGQGIEMEETKMLNETNQRIEKRRLDNMNVMGTTWCADPKNEPKRLMLTLLTSECTMRGGRSIDFTIK